MFTTSNTTPSVAARDQGRALHAWSEAEALVRLRWRAFLEAPAANRSWAFASYVAALDAEEVAADELAAFDDVAA